ncbi:MAG: 16S rRNA (guanine(966)-N(2))-methyltransferase RsmD [Deltaproteobacteria bacterium]|nr:16S rRNA (guanine(966)-N(2))-methyltransferase RsmD [Deltaproteobacteria bacterium]
MPIRLHSGLAKGQKLFTPKNLKIRPASARVRKSLFDILGDLSGKQILDLFAGTGSLGLTGLSKGASACVFVDADSQAIHLIQENLKKIGFYAQAQVLQKKVLEAIPYLENKKQSFDIIFVDPPYDQGLLMPSLKALSASSLASKKTVLICEHSPREVPSFLSGLELIDQRKYGQTWVSFFKIYPRESEEPN